MITVQTFVTGDLATNTYLIKDSSASCLAVIDPGDNSAELISAIEQNGGELQYILLTHGHFDHIGFVNDLCTRYSPKVAVSKKELELINSPVSNLSVYHTKPIDNINTDLELSDGDVIKLGDTDIKFIETPGHTKGSGCYIADNFIFSGDTLFCESFGRTDFATGSFSDISASIRRLLSLDGEYTVYTGHGVPTTLSHERKFNPLSN